MNRPSDVPVDGAFERLSAIIAEMRDAITRTRMQRIENLFVGLPRMVRDLSAELGKQVLVDIEGGDVELDREMIEMIRDPLTHIIRNAVDHGIETPAERLKAGKREIGILAVSARQSGNQILIDILDDGQGIDGKKLVEKAIASGIVDKDEAAAADPARAAGADLRGRAFDRQGGHRDLRPRRRHGRRALQHRADRRHRRGRQPPGEGTRMTLRVPLTLTIIPALTVSIGGQHFAIPRSAIEEIVRANGEIGDARALGGAGVATIRGRRVPEVSLADILGLESEVDEKDRTLVVLRPAGGDVYALAVDRIHDHEELVVKPAAPAVMATGLYAGTTLADDGSPILLFDPAGLAAGRRRQAGGAGARRAHRRGPRHDGPKATPVLLFRGLDGGRRALRLAVVDRIEEVPSRRDPRSCRAASRPARRGDPAAGRRDRERARRREGPPVPPQRRRARNRLCLRRGHRLRGDRQ